MNIRRLLISSALPALAICLTPLAAAQVEITDERTAGVSTSSAGDGGAASDITVTSTGTITITSGPGITIDSDNVVVNGGVISSLGSDDTTGVLISGSRTGGFTNNNRITLSENAPADGITPTGTIAQGSGRVGILISGASPFTGNIDNSSTGSIAIIGQDSAGIRLAAMSTMTGDIINSGNISIFGERSVGIDVAGNVIGNLAVGGNLSIAGEDAVGVNVSGDVTGGLAITGIVASSAYIASAGNAISTRPNLASRALLLSDGNIRQVGSPVNISGNISNGVIIAETLNDDGVQLAVGGVTIIGSAPAILIDGQGTPIAIGLVGQITDPADENFNADLQYAFVNQGTLVSDGLLDDVDATVFSLADATLSGGLNNTNIMRSTVYRSGVDPDAAAATNDAHARVIVIGGGGIAERINNAGTILARGFEATDSIYVDPDAILAPNFIRATAIDILAGGSLASITNISTISAVLTARSGEAVAIRDASGTLIEINNSGVISALAISSDPDGNEATNFNLIAIDVSANASGFTFNQTAYTDPDSGDVTTPSTVGDIYLGSGADVLNIAAGSVTGDVSFGDGADRLELSGSSTLTGSVTDSDGQLDILVTDNSRLAITGPANINVTTALIDSTSTYSPFIDPTTGDSSVLMASGAVTFEDGAIIAPRLATVLVDPSASFTIVQAGMLNINTDIGTLRSDQTPFLYNTVFSRDPSDANALILTLNTRTAAELGLDIQQTAAFTSAFEALQSSSSLGGAFVAITEQTGFNAAYNQLMPEFAAASRQFVLANVDGATGAVGSHLATARDSQGARKGGAWIEEFAYFADRDLAGLSEQFRGYGFGITGGFDTAYGPFHAVGINAGFATTEIEDVLGVDSPLDVLTVQLGAYAGYKSGKLGVDFYAGGGYNDFSTERKVIIGDFNESSQADWSGLHYNASVNAGYDISFGKYFARPNASVTYLNLNEKAYHGNWRCGYRAGHR